MARIWSCGFELNSVTAGVELSNSPSNTTISSSTVKSGTYALRVNPTASTGQSIYTYKSVDTQGSFFYRFYFRIATAPGATTEVFATRSESALFRVVGFRLTSSRTLELYNFEDSAQVGSASSALALNTWYRVELSVNTTTLASTTLDALVDGVSFASGTVNLANAQSHIQFGVISTSVTTDLFFDDLAVNDSTGSFQNSWPGEGKIIHLTPNADYAHGFLKSGGGAGDATNYQELDEITPDDATTYLKANGSSMEDYSNLTATGLSVGDTINVIQGGVRFAGAAASANTPASVSVNINDGDGPLNGSIITPNSTTWRTNANAVPFNYTYTAYQAIGATAITATMLDGAKLGVSTDAGDTNYFYVSTLWLLVDYTPAAGGAGRNLASGRNNASNRSNASSRNVASGRVFV